MIITLEQIKQEVGRCDDSHDELLSRKLAEAELQVTNYLKVADDFYGGSGINDFPVDIAAAVIEMTRMKYDEPEKDPLSTGVKNALHRHRDPALA